MINNPWLCTKRGLTVTTILKHPSTETYITACPFQLSGFRKHLTAAQPTAVNLLLKSGPFHSSKPFIPPETTSYFTFTLWLCVEEPRGLVICLSGKETNSSLAGLMEKQAH